MVLTHTEYGKHFTVDQFRLLKLMWLIIQKFTYNFFDNFDDLSIEKLIAESNKKDLILKL